MVAGCGEGDETAVRTETVPPPLNIRLEGGVVECKEFEEEEVVEEEGEGGDGGGGGGG